MIQINKTKFSSYLNYFLLLFILLLFNKIIYTFFLINIGQTDGSYIYPLDDTYIHLAMAKNIAFYNNWGVVYNEFCSTSSSPIFTLIIAFCIKIFGDSSIYPFVVNLFFANLIIILLFLYFKNKPLPFIFCFLFLLCPVLLHVQVLNGMEHTMHIFLVLLTLILLKKVVDSNFSINKYKCGFLFAIGLICLTRYESMFFLTAIIFIILLLKQYKLAFLTLVVGFLPIVLFGIYSLANGGYFFPNSLLIKGNIDISYSILSLINKYLNLIYYNLKTRAFSIPLMIIIFLIIIHFIRYKEYSLKGLISLINKNYLIVITLITLLTHSMFASFGWLFRYEAYLYALLYFTLVVVVVDEIRYWKIIKQINIYALRVSLSLCILFFVLLLSNSTIHRFTESKNTMLVGSKNIYDQQIQMSKFLQKYYVHPKVLANDIGAIVYFNKIELLDIVGLGSNSILKMKREKKFNSMYMYNSIEQYNFLTEYPYNEYTIIMIYDSWFNIKTENDYKQLGWLKIGELKIQNNVVCGSDKVSFYSNNINDATEMRRNLLLFKNDVPKDVTITVF